MSAKTTTTAKIRFFCVLQFQQSSAARMRDVKVRIQLKLENTFSKFIVRENYGRGHIIRHMQQ